MKLINKDALVAEIESLKSAAETMLTGKTDLSYWKAQKHLCERILSFIDNLEVKEVDLEKELIEWHKKHFKKDGTFIGMSGFYLTNNSQMDIAKHFFELGLKAKKGE